MAAGYGLAGVRVPLVIAAVGVIASILGTFFVQTGEKADQAALLGALHRGVYTRSATPLGCLSSGVIDPRVTTTRWGRASCKKRKPMGGRIILAIRTTRSIA